MWVKVLECSWVIEMEKLLVRRWEELELGKVSVVRG